MRDDKERPKSAWFGSLDLLGGVRREGAIGGAMMINPFLDRRGGLRGKTEKAVTDLGKVVRETAGENWVLVVNDNFQLETMSDFLTIQNRMPRYSLVYSRGYGRLLQAHFGISHLIEKLVGRGLASQQDLMVISLLKHQGFDLAVSLILEGEQPSLFLSRVQLLPAPMIVASKPEQAQMDPYGFIPGRPTHTWQVKVDGLEGGVRVEVDGEDAVLFFQMGEKRREVLRVKRNVWEVSGFDRLVIEGMPEDSQIIELKQAVLSENEG